MSLDQGVYKVLHWSNVLKLVQLWSSCPDGSVRKAYRYMDTWPVYLWTHNAPGYIMWVWADQQLHLSLCVCQSLSSRSYTLLLFLSFGPTLWETIMSGSSSSSVFLNADYNLLLSEEYDSGHRLSLLSLTANTSQRDRERDKERGRERETITCTSLDHKCYYCRSHYIGQWFHKWGAGPP